MENFIKIHFRGICTHLVHDSPHEGAPTHIGLLPIHIRLPHPPIRHRVLLPWSLDLPPHLVGKIPRHYPRLRYKTDDVDVPKKWNPQPMPDGRLEVDMTGVAVWISGVDEARQGLPPAAVALTELPSVWKKTTGIHAKPEPDPKALNEFQPGKVAAYVDFFGDHELQRLVKPVNEVIATLRIKDTASPGLVWLSSGHPPETFPIKPGATIEIGNTTNEVAPCCEIDYLLHYRATLLDLFQPPPPPPPKWDPDELPGPEGAFCSSSTYP